MVALTAGNLSLFHSVAKAVFAQPAESDNDLLDMDYFLNEDIFDDSDDFEEGFYIF